MTLSTAAHKSGSFTVPCSQPHCVWSSPDDGLRAPLGAYP
nr:MAG TPA: glycoprotein [Caudoviricetes sp.]